MGVQDRALKLYPELLTHLSLSSLPRDWLDLQITGEICEMGKA